MPGTYGQKVIFTWLVVLLLVSIAADVRQRRRRERARREALRPKGPRWPHPAGGDR
jgi:hypothetical protein